jgi:hypothetical protein
MTAVGTIQARIGAGMIVAAVLAVSVAAGGSEGGGDKPAGITYEHYAFTSWMVDKLDGPRREAVGRGPGPLDEEFNCYVGGRVIRAGDGMVMSIAGGLPEFGQDEGPAAFLPRISPIRGTGYGQSIGGWLVVGLPLQGGDKGCLYAYSDSHIMKVWKNPDRNDRWWAKIVAGPGKVEIPGGRIYGGHAWRKQGEKEYKAVFFTKAGFCVLEEADDGVKFNSLLTIDSITAHLPEHVSGGRKSYPTQGVMCTGGYFYLGYYFSHGFNKNKEGAAYIQRVSPDGATVEPWVTHCGARKGTDGPGMKTGWHCGPHMSLPRASCPWYPPGVVVFSAHDEHTLRRVTRDGRISTLYEDGQWRESTNYDRKNHVDGVSGFVYGADGRALGCACGEGKSKKRGEAIYLIKGIDFTKPTAGK